MDAPLRIALISEHASPLATIGGVDAGGQNVYVAHLARCLAREGHHVDVFTRRDSPGLAPVVGLGPGVRVVHIDAGPACFVPKEELLGHMPAFARATEAFMRMRMPYDLAHANFFMSGWVAHRLREALGLPFVITFHALGLVRLQHQKDVDSFPSERLDIERRLAREADAIVAECPEDRNDLVRLYGADTARMTVVPCGFDPDEFSPMDRTEARANLGLPASDFVALQLGRLVPRKGIDNVIRSLAHLPAGRRAQLLIVGGDTAEPGESSSPELARLRAVARDCHVDSQVSFVGHRKRAELRSYYAAADVFVTTPWYEPFGITPLEAMACGIPVIGSDVGGIRYSVSHGTTGFLVAPRDPALLAGRLAQLRADPELAGAMGRAGVSRAHAMFTWERVTSDMIEVYAAVRRKPIRFEPASRQHARLLPASEVRAG